MLRWCPNGRVRPGRPIQHIPYILGSWRGLIGRYHGPNQQTKEVATTEGIGRVWDVRQSLELCALGIGCATVRSSIVSFVKVDVKRITVRYTPLSDVFSLVLFDVRVCMLIKGGASTSDIARQQQQRAPSSLHSTHLTTNPHHITSRPCSPAPPFQLPSLLASPHPRLRHRDTDPSSRRICPSPPCNTICTDHQINPSSRG